MSDGASWLPLVGKGQEWRDGGRVRGVEGGGREEGGRKGGRKGGWEGGRREEGGGRREEEWDKGREK